MISVVSCGELTSCLPIAYISGRMISGPTLLVVLIPFGVEYDTFIAALITEFAARVPFWKAPNGVDRATGDVQRSVIDGGEPPDVSKVNVQ